MEARGENALAAFHRALETGGSTYDKRVKILLVGQDRVGKTSLGKALRGEPFDEAEMQYRRCANDPCCQECWNRRVEKSSSC